MVSIKSQINEETIATMVDSGATKNFISLEEAQRIGLKVVPTKTKIKATNFSTRSLMRVTKRVPMKIRKW